MGFIISFGFLNTEVVLFFMVLIINIGVIFYVIVFFIEWRMKIYNENIIEFFKLYVFKLKYVVV